MDRIDARQGRGDQRVAHFVMGDAAAFLRAEHAALLFKPRDDAFDRGGEIIERHRVGLAPRRHDGGLVDQVGEIGAGEAGRQRGDLVEIDAVREADLGDVDLEDLQPPRAVRPVDQHLAVETPGPEQGRIEHLRAIGGADQDHPARRIEAVEFGEQLIERLLLLVVAAT